MQGQYDYIIIGAGLVGLATAYELLQADPTVRLLVLEKEDGVALHQSGHNSGVIHSGIYYKPGSLKARNCISGYHKLLEFADLHGISYDLCGKIIVASAESEIPLLENIYERGVANGLKSLKYLSREEFRETEPHCEGVRAVHVPQTGIIDYPAVAKKLAELISIAGADIAFGQRVTSIREESSHITVSTLQDQFYSRKLISCGGLYSDCLTSMTTRDNDVAIIPFRGEYYQLKEEKKHLVKNLIYPVPDPNFPFLGVHFTRMIDGNIEAGPNAVLAFKKEGYQFWDVNLKEFAQTFFWPGFRKIVGKYGKTGLGEIHRSLSKKAFTKALQKLVPEIQEDDLIKGGAGIRAQACDRGGNLLDDFSIVQQKNIVHVRNAPSPAATACFAIGKQISVLASES